jgi:GWxTD domain-containing protein
MNRWGRLFLSASMSVGVFLAAAAHAQAPSAPQQQPADQQSNQKQDNGKKKPSDRQLTKELATPYKKWLDEEVGYIITDQERRSFLQLQTNEEREQFIEAFWQRRNPDPDSVDNPVNEEHYRRIAYANEHYSSGIPGWKTDRGHIYIMYGEPASIESHTAGEMWDRPEDQGGGTTQTYAYEDWTYHYIEGIGENVELEFIDPSGTGEFYFTTDPSQKDAFLHTPGAGLTTAEQLSGQGQADRFTNTDGTNMAPSMNGFRPESLDEFNRIDMEAKVFTPPVVKFKDLEAMVSSRIVRDQLRFTYKWDFLRIIGDTVLVPITVQIPNNQMTFQGHDGVHVATLDLFGRLSTLTGRVVQTFEDTVKTDVPDSLLQSSMKNVALYQKAIPLRPGLYKLDLVIKDTTSNNVGVVDTRLAVPTFEDDKFDATQIILADSITPVAAKEIGVGMFVLGSMKVRPKLDETFSSDAPMGVYMQFYNLKMDEKTHKNNVSFDLQVFQGDQSVVHVEQTSAQMKQTAEQVTFQDAVPLSTLPPGKYRIEIKATDAVANQTITRSADFTVTPAAGNNAPAAQTSSTR